MHYHIYRRTDGGAQLLGSTRFLQDASSILANWNSGYIVTSSGAMIEEKNM